MRRNCFGFILLGILTAGSVFSQDTKVPVPITNDDQLLDKPFSYNGIITAGGYTGSGSMVSDGIMVTAAHVLYNETISLWEPIGDIRYFPRYNRGDDIITGSHYQPVRYFGWTSYSGDSYHTRVQEDDSGPGYSEPHTFNMDFAVCVFSSSITASSITDFAEIQLTH